MSVGVVAPTCESRFKAPIHTALAGEADTPSPRADRANDSGCHSVIVLAHGPDRYLARQAAIAAAAELDPEGLNTSWLDGRESSVEQIIAAVGSATFFGAPRVVIVTDLLARAGRGSDGSATDDAPVDPPSRNARPLDPLLSAVPDAHGLILFEPSLASPPPKFKSSVPTAKIIPGEPPRGASLLSWIGDAARHAGASIDRQTAQLLAEVLFPQTWNRKPNNPRFDRPPDMGLLLYEIEKLAVAAHPGPITAELIAALVPGAAQQRLFSFIDAALSGDVGTAAGELDRLLTSGEEPAMLLAQILGQVELTTVAAGDRDAASVARDLGTISPGRVSAVMSLARKLPSVRSRAETGVATDRALKTGRIRHPSDALHALLLAYATGPRERNSGRSW
jgi:DNA polymerase III delta subunit